MHILLVEDHPIFRAGVKPFLLTLSNQVEIHVAESRASVDRLLEQSQYLDLALIDLKLPGSCGFDILHLLNEQIPGLPVIILSASDDKSAMRRALREGAKGFITKDTKPDLMLNAMQLVLAGGTYVPELLISDIRGKIDENGRYSIPEARIESLTNRQLDVLKLLVNGQSNKEIGETINCTESTVKAHVTAVLKTLGVANRAKAAEAAKNWGWLQTVV